ncbi:MAG: energy-coupling factor ABC transporter ATP-binding protein [Anaerolineales bacterium]|jgi:cobalt/nickel transport system ATP-binding protein
MPIIHVQNQGSNTKFSLCEACALSVEDLNFAYPDGHQALEHISFNIEMGEKVALVGPNGAGKSTLMLHLNGILVGTGRIQIDGVQVTKENLPDIRARVGLVFQNPDDQLFSPTVFEDVAFGPLHMGLCENEIYGRVDTALSQVGMEDFRNRLSHHLSMGEKKRIAIATVLSMTPSILVLDEPTAGLDPRSRRSLINLLDQLPNTLLVSTHDMRMVRDLFPRMIIMDRGQIVADSKTVDLMKNPDLLEQHGLEAP